MLTKECVLDFQHGKTLLYKLFFLFSRTLKFVRLYTTMCFIKISSEKCIQSGSADPETRQIIQDLSYSGNHLTSWLREYLVFCIHRKYLNKTFTWAKYTYFLKFCVTNINVTGNTFMGNSQSPSIHDMPQSFILLRQNGIHRCQRLPRDQTF